MHRHWEFKKQPGRGIRPVYIYIVIVILIIVIYVCIYSIDR